jgi:hypothetical protein
MKVVQRVALYESIQPESDPNFFESEVNLGILT